MTFAIVIACYGDPAWMELAWSRAYPAALDQAGGPTIDVVYLPHGTLAEARNEGARRNDAEWLCFLDADDELDPGFMEAMLDPAWQATTPPLTADSARIHPASLLAPAVTYVYPDGRETPPAIPNAGGWPDVNECVIGTLVRRECFLEVGGFRDLPSLEDWDLWLRVVKEYDAPIVQVPAAVYRAHVRPGSRNSDQSVYDQLRAEHAEVWAPRPG